MMRLKTALITGIAGQDGSYLAEFLVAKGYQVFGLVTAEDFARGLTNLETILHQITLVKGDLLNTDQLESLIRTYQPAEIYNLGGKTFIPESWARPTLTLDANTLGLARLLESLRLLTPHSRLFQASSAKMFGQPTETPQTETTPFHPLDPYSIAKTASHYLVQAYRQTHRLFTVAGILYNHESERRGFDFVTRKISRAAAAIKLGQAAGLTLGNLDARQDWGYAPDYVEVMWLMLQRDLPEDFVIATGATHSISEICEIAFRTLELDWQKYVTVSDSLTRVEEPTRLVGDATKAHRLLNWRPKTSFSAMIEKMVRFDYQQCREHDDKQ